MLILLLVGIEAQAVFIVGMRCHLAGGNGGTLRDSNTLETHKTFFDLFLLFQIFLARFKVDVCFSKMALLLVLNFIARSLDWRLEVGV